jgi:N-glycosidase YbiA
MSCRHSARNRKRQHPIPPVKLLGLLLPMAAQLIIPPDDRILYCVRDRQTFGFLSHFYISPIRLNDQLWPSAEHFYQAQKSTDAAYQEAIRTAPSPAIARRPGANPNGQSRASANSWFRKHGTIPRADWLSINVNIMRQADLAKFSQHPDLLNGLLTTGNAELIEDSPWDAFWGTGRNGQGLNWAGRILMEVRSISQTRDLKGFLREAH